MAKYPLLQRRRLKPGGLLRCGPLVGLRDSLDPETSNDPLRASAVLNMYPLELDKPSTFVGRPGFQQAGSQLGAATKRTGQLVYEFTKLDGTTYTVAIVGGQGIYTFDWSTRAWTQVVTVANLTTASITLSETARCYAVTFSDKMLVSDGANVAFLWDGTSGAGGLTKLTNVPVFFGQPTIHGGKVFGIKSTARSTFVWSEENDATTGYEQTGYTNFWVMGQTDQEALYALRGTNAGLHFFRSDSAGVILGAVNADFITAATHDGVSETHGTLSPAAVAYHEREIFYLNRFGRPYVASGGTATPIWQDIHETARGIDKSAIANAVALYDPTTSLILFGVAENGHSDPNMLLVFNPVLKVPVAVWRFDFQAIGVVRNASGVPVLMHLSADGYAYDHGTADGDLWDDELNAGTQAIPHAVGGPHMGTDLRRNKRFIRADVVMRAESDTTEVNFSYTTPVGASSQLTTSTTGNLTRWDEFDWDEAPWAAESTQARAVFGLNGLGRWIRPRVAHEVVGERFGFEALGIEYQMADDSPLSS